MSLRRSSSFLLALLVAAVPAFGGEGDANWPQWRGPAGDGTTEAAPTATEWGPDRNVRWRTPLPEAGNSTPVVWGDRIFLTQPVTEGSRRELWCLDRATGRELWRRGVAYDEGESTHRTNPYASASPATDAERVVAWFGSAGLICWDVDGTELWRRDLGRQEHQWGYGSSPILYDNLCILPFGPGPREFLIAVDKTTGETVWQVDALDDAAERNLSGPENDGNANDYRSDKPREKRLRGTWGTPILVEVDGRTELVMTLPRRVSGFNPATGERLWTCGGAAPLAYASPMAAGDVVVVLGGYGGASFAVRAGGRGDVTETRRLWHQPKGGSWLGTGVVVDGFVYICNMGGVLHCLDANTGEERWKARAGDGGTWSSVTLTGDGLAFLLTKSGVTTVFRPDPEAFQLVAENDLGESTNASVVATEEELLIRTDEALWSIGDPPADGAGRRDARE
ncbi:PQQ-binding-like beta-propeller repeat protein [Alienimonas chondri]|uniref:Outer membrane protein assembly factor BamB n=1 Tax=Alienimonas chondri TaxID=2681879 RepID=A0ABX1V856_9PLAN|nr:PQQ-binding-like beta-propeller repeat protein [Alienimonas chondri]NNJ24112.1 Outer membrane protein assembly factor BamB [Alienimonas chondri]